LQGFGAVDLRQKGSERRRAAANEIVASGSGMAIERCRLIGGVKLTPTFSAVAIEQSQFFMDFEAMP
jgi:hypothetical protein